MNRRPVKTLMRREVQSVDPETSLPAAARLMEQSGSSCLVIVDDDIPVGIVTERDMVKTLSHLLVTRGDGLLAVKDIMSCPPWCLTEDAKIYEALVVMQSRRIRHIPIVDEDRRLLGVLSETDIANAYFKHAEEWRGQVEQEVRDRTNELMDANKKLRALALQDSLLRIGNRRAMEVDAHFTHINAVRYARSYVLVLLDVDCFKDYNDHYGHQAGDDVLKRVSSCIGATIRAGDRLYRYGGEEFLVIMSETGINEAVEAMRRVVERVQGLKLPHSKSPYGVVTVSAGIGAVTSPPIGSSWKTVLKKADNELYKAKEEGRNQVCWQVTRHEHHNPARISYLH